MTTIGDAIRLLEKLADDRQQILTRALSGELDALQEMRGMGGSSRFDSGKLKKDWESLKLSAQILQSFGEAFDKYLHTGSFPKPDIVERLKPR